MAIDVRQFFDDFYEECLEALETIESGLLHPEQLDDDGINELFRAAHSIKGGAGTVGIMSVSEFTHDVETLMDAVRKGTHPLDEPTCDLLLRSCDGIRSLMAAENDGSEVDRVVLDAITRELAAAVEGGSGNASTPSSPEAGSSGDDGEKHFIIHLKPGEQLLAFGNDPAALFDSLRDFGELTITADCSALPDLDSLNPEVCYLSWILNLRGNVSRLDIDDVFDWIADLCELTIEETPSAAEAADDKPSDIAVARSNDGGSNARADNKQSKTGSIRVNTDKIDQIINMVGELVITQAMLRQAGREIVDMDGVDSGLAERLSDGLSELERHTRELQQSAMSIRMVGVSFAFNRFPRLVHDLSQKLGKRIELEVYGENTEIDKTLIERIGDPLVHLLRNSIDHGIESPEERLAAGKPAAGTIRLEACHRNGYVVIEVADDGRGMDPEKLMAKAREKGLLEEGRVLNEKQALELIFEPGFSTTTEVSDLSGRGVGMDVVRSNVKELGGDVELYSTPGQGTRCVINLPLTLAILDGQTLRIGKDFYVIAVASILESIQLAKSSIRRINRHLEVFRWRDQQLPLIHLDQVLETPVDNADADTLLVMIVESGGKTLGMSVSELLAQEQVVIKSLEENFVRVEGFSGATIMGDGSVALILDVAGIVKIAGDLAGREHTIQEAEAVNE